MTGEHVARASLAPSFGCLIPFGGGSLLLVQKGFSELNEEILPKAEDELDKWMNSMEDKLKTNDSQIGRAHV